MSKNKLSLSLDKYTSNTFYPSRNNYSTELLPLKPENILQKFPQEELDSCWDSLCINVIQNYQRGKGTFIKGFGTFTLKNSEINLEGTTNEIFRDKKSKKPVFIVSKEFNPNLLPGEFNPVSGIRYYISKENKNINILNLNYSEIAFSLNMNKDKVNSIIKCLLAHINESIINKKFKYKKMGILGTLMLKNNILVVKFNEDFENNISRKNKIFNDIKFRISLDRNLEGTKNLNLGNFPNLYKTSENLKSNNSLVTHCEPTAKKYLKDKFNITINNSNYYNYNNTINNFSTSVKNKNRLLTNRFFNQKDYPFKFINDNNDNKKERNYSSPKSEENKTKDNPLSLLDNNTLKTISFLKGSLIKDSKDLDLNKNGSISKEQAIYVLIKNIPELKYDLAKQIIEFYFITEQIDYMKLIALLIKGCKNSFLKKKGLFDFAQYLFKNTGIVFPKNKNFNLKDVIKKQKNKKIEILKQADKEREKLKELAELENNKNKIINDEEKPIFYEEQKNIEKNVKELLFISDLVPKLKTKYAISLDQNINVDELLRILKDYEIYYQKDDVIDILKFIEINNLEKFSLQEFIDKIYLCKVINKTNDLTQFSNILKHINDIIYMNGGKNFLFNNDINKKNTLDVNTFIKLIKPKTSLLDTNTIKNAFYYIVKTSRDMTVDDYIEFFEKKSKKKLYDEPYYINMMKKIILVISDKFMTCGEYFDRLLSYNESTQDKVISRINWVKYLQYEKFNFNAEELDYLFDWIDTKKDNVIDQDEFTQKYHYTIKPLTVLKNVIHNNKLDIEDLAHRMGIEGGDTNKIYYQNFVQHMKKLDYILPESFIRAIFNELKEKDNNNKNNEYILSKKFLDAINYIQPAHKYKSFTKNYIDTVKSKTTYEELKKRFEIFDQGSLGTMTKLEYVKSMSKIFPEFSDDDHMRFIRIMDLLEKSTNKVIYPELLNIIFYANVNKKNDKFTIICEFLLEKLNKECDNDIQELMSLIDTGKIKRKTLDKHKPLSIEQLQDFLKKENILIDKKVIQKLDLDSDGVISYDDLYAILFRYKDTLYFKYYNNSNDANINLFTKDSLPKEKIRILVQKLLNHIKTKNITLFGLFKKFDTDDNGLISNIDFNQGLKKYLNIDAALADPFFAYLDYYNIGMINFEIFKSRLTYIDESHLGENDRKEENEIIGKLKSFIIKNKNLSDNEIFQIMDKDIDGIISPQDLMIFSKDNLNIPEKFLNKNKIERVMMTLSLSKNLQVGFNDISEFIKISKITTAQKQNLDLKEVFSLTSNQNLSQNKKNVDWINDIIVRLGMYVSEKYESIDEFFNECVIKGSDKFKFNDFIKFHENHYDLFNNGFHLTNDELLAVFTSLDSQKKNYLTKQDLENKLSYFNFYKKMHFDLKDFFQSNFYNGIDAFKYFFKNEKQNEEIKYYITIKQFFDGFENFFPNKYEYNTVLKYLNKYFHLDIPSSNKDNKDKEVKNNEENKKIKDIIEFTEFNYIYFDKFESNEVFLKNYSKEMKLLNNHNSEEEKKTYYLSELFNKKKNPILITPFDSNSLNKLIRIIDSSKYDIDAIFDSVIKENDNNPNLNKFQFRDFIKKLNIGLTNIEIDQIIREINGPSNGGLNENLNLEIIKSMLKNDKWGDRYTGEENIKKKISEIKSLIYKFYSSPILCFQINDLNNSGKIDFQKYRNLLNDLYIKGDKEIPNFALIKNTFDYIDLRKDGIIDYNEWNKAFSMVNGKLDLEFEKYTTDENELKFNKKYKNELRLWENSDDIRQKYMFIYKNRKQIKNKLIDGNFVMNKYGKQLVNSDTLIYVIKKMFPNLKLSNVQWKILTDIGKDENVNNYININNFFKLVELSSKKNNINNIKPFTSNSEFNKIYYGNFDTLKSLNCIKKNKFKYNENINKTLSSTSCGNPRFKNIQI